MLPSFSGVADKANVPASAQLTTRKFRYFRRATKIMQNAAKWPAKIRREALIFIDEATLQHFVLLWSRDENNETSNNFYIAALAQDAASMEHARPRKYSTLLQLQRDIVQSCKAMHTPACGRLGAGDLPDLYLV